MSSQLTDFRPSLVERRKKQVIFQQVEIFSKKSFNRNYFFIKKSIFSSRNRKKFQKVRKKTFTTYGNGVKSGSCDSKPLFSRRETRKVAILWTAKNDYWFSSSWQGGVPFFIFASFWKNTILLDNNNLYIVVFPPSRSWFCGRPLLLRRQQKRRTLPGAQKAP